MHDLWPRRRWKSRTQQDAAFEALAVREGGLDATQIMGRKEVMTEMDVRAPLNPRGDTGARTLGFEDPRFSKAG